MEPGATEHGRCVLSGTDDDDDDDDEEEEEDGENEQLRRTSS